jgi:hypothetical protein
MWGDTSRQVGILVERFSNHEKADEVRYTAIQSTMSEIKTTMEKNHQDNRGGRRAIYALLWSFVGTVGLGLVGTVVWFFVHSVQWKMPT